MCRNLVSRGVNRATRWQPGVIVWRPAKSSALFFARTGTPTTRFWDTEPIEQIATATGRPVPAHLTRSNPSPPGSRSNGPIWLDSRMDREHVTLMVNWAIALPAVRSTAATGPSTEVPTHTFCVQRSHPWPDRRTVLQRAQLVTSGELSCPQ
jgi:hypothetical protein